MKTIYLDYSATTPIKKEVQDAMIPYITDHFGNASSLYELGQTTKTALNGARKSLASLINADEKEIYFTGSGTESNNHVLRMVSFLNKDKKPHIITSAIEHHAILHTADYLSKLGVEVSYVNPNSDGFISKDDVISKIQPNTCLVSIMLANNEIGTIQPIKDIVTAVKAKNEKILCHTDAVQAVGNIKVDVIDLDVDFLSMSAHKIYGPKGVGGLFVKRGVKIPPFIYGGAQERNMRAGTENVAGIVGFGKAAELAKNNLENHIKNLTELRNHFIDRVLKEIEGTMLNGSRGNRLPGNANIGFKFIEGESMLLMLDLKGICISTGSACSSASLEPSHVLMAIGVNIEDVHGCVRFTIGDMTTKDELDFVVDTLKDVVARLREISALS